MNNKTYKKNERKRRQKMKKKKSCRMVWCDLN